VSDKLALDITELVVRHCRRCAVDARHSAPCRPKTSMHGAHGSGGRTRTTGPRAQTSGGAHLRL